MKSITKKTVSAVLIASMAMSFAACSKKKTGDVIQTPQEPSHSGEKITEDMPWFDSKMMNVPFSEKTDKKLVELDQMFAGADDKYIVVLNQARYDTSELDTGESGVYDTTDYGVSEIQVMDRNTLEVVKTINLFGDNLKFDGIIEDVTYYNGVVTLHGECYEDAGNENFDLLNLEVDIDVSTESIVDKRTSDYESSFDQITQKYNIGKYLVETSLSWGEDNEQCKCNLNITSADGTKKVVTLSEDKKDLYDVPMLILTSEDKAIAAVLTDDGTNLYYNVDLAGGTASKADSKDAELLDGIDTEMAFSDNDGNVYAVKPYGIVKVNMKERKLEEHFDFGNCSLSSAIFDSCDLVSCSGNELIFAGEERSENAFEFSNIKKMFIIKVSKADKNPHAGKTILELYTPAGYVDNYASEAIKKFNDTNGEYFIEVTKRYAEQKPEVTWGDVNSNDDLDSAMCMANYQMSNQLAIDLINGDGPDILLDVYDYGQLNNSNYLMDLTPYVGTLDPSKYFTNVFDAAKVDGKLYQIPISFEIDGIMTDKKYGGQNGIGFTTGEYENFLKTALNGEDVIYNGQALYFTKLFNAEIEKFISNGKADFTSPEFATLAEFVKNNVPENAVSWDDMYAMDGDDVTYEGGGVGCFIFKGDRKEDKEEIAYFKECYGFGSYLECIGDLHGGNGFYGIPSTDGRGPVIRPTITVAISAQATNADVCGEFVKLLMSDDTMNTMAMQDYFVINRNAFNSAAGIAIEFYNGDGGNYLDDWEYEGDNSVNRRPKFSEQNIQDMIAIIENCSQMSMPDPSINIILIEEMPAYFSGQKNLDDVVKIAQDRAQKVLDERG